MPKTQNKFLIFVILSAIIAVIVFSVAILFIENKTKIKQENLFQEHQFQIAAATTRNLESHLDLINSQSRKLAWWELPNYLDGVQKNQTISELLFQFYSGFDSAVSYVYLDKDQKVVAQKISPQLNPKQTKEIYHGWIEKHWDPAGNSNAMGTIPEFNISPETQISALFIPIFSKGEFAGYLITLIDLGMVAAKFVGPARVGEYGASYLLDQNGGIVYDHEAEVIGRNVFDGLHASYPDVLRYDTRLISEQSGKGSYHYTLDQSGATPFRKLAAWNSIEYGENKLIVVFSAPDSAIDQGFDTLHWILISIAGLFAFLIITILAVFLKTNTRQLKAQNSAYKQDAKNFNKALIQSENMIDGMAAAYPDLGLVFDAKGTYIDIFGNEALLYLPKEQMIGRRIFDILPNNLATLLQENIDKTLKTKKPIEYEYEVTINDINYHCEAKMAPILDGAKKPKKVVLVARDVTSRIEAKKAADKALMDAENANIAKSEFLANISHELRTPLNAILGFAEIIEGEAIGPIGDKRYSSYAHDIHTSGNHLLALLNDILDLSKIEAGKYNLREEPCDLQDLIYISRSIMASLAQKKHITLNYHGPESCIVKADEKAFRQILLNILSNAIKFTDTNGFIDINLIVHDNIFIVITDTGIGISPEDIERIMEPFIQIETARQSNEGGTGIGLPLTDRLVRLHGGNMKIESTLGEGTKITIMIPNERLLDQQQQGVLL